MSELFPEKNKGLPITDNDWAELFEKIAELHPPKTPMELQRTVRELFHENADVERRYDKWIEKVAFDRNKLKQIFNK